jgi:hypothetical protein
MDTLPAVDRDTRAVAQAWFDALTHGRGEEAVALMADDVEFVNYRPVPGYNTDMPWIGTHRGPEQVLASLGVFLGVCEVLEEELVALAVDGEEAFGVVRERSVVRSTGEPFEIEFVQRLTVRGGRIARWVSYTDPSPIVRAIRGAYAP